MSISRLWKKDENIFISKSDFEESLKKLTPLELSALWQAMQDHDYFENLFHKMNEMRKTISEMETYIDDIKDSYDEISYSYEKLFKEIKEK
jgi:acyl carrier protein phosphodiesterase